MIRDRPSRARVSQLRASAVALFAGATTLGATECDAILRAPREQLGADDMSASADTSSSSFGIASGTRGARLEVTGTFGGVAPFTAGTAVASGM